MGEYKKELESEDGGSVSSYQEGDPVDVGNCFELMQDVLEQWKMQKEEKLMRLEGMLEKAEAEIEQYKQELN